MHASHTRSGRPSSTAHLIARTVAALPHHQQYRQQVDPETARLAQLLCDGLAGGRDPLLHRLKASWFRRLVFAAEHKIVPGLFVHYALRKKQLREYAAKKIQQGSRQLLILGAGLDTIGIELSARFKDLRCVELDFPTTLAARKNALKESGLYAGYITRGEVDLAETLADPETRLLAALQNTRLDPQAATVVVAEGLFMYLQAEDVQRILRQLNHYFNKELFILFTYLDRDKKGQPSFVRPGGVSGFMDLVLRRMGEPFLWSIDDRDLDSFVTYSDLRLENLIRPSGKNIGEAIAVCSKAL